MLEVRKVTATGSVPFIMITSWAQNDGDYPYQGFPSGLVGEDEWVVRVTNDNPRTIFHESSIIPSVSPRGQTALLPQAAPRSPTAVT
jgi:hypothetical protein